MISSSYNFSVDHIMLVFNYRQSKSNLLMKYYLLSQQCLGKSCVTSMS